MAFHGALIGSIVAIVLFAQRVGALPWSVLDVCAAATPMGLFFGRLANFINAELWGRPSTVAWSMVFPGGGPVSRHPSQLYEAFLEGALLFAVLWWLTHSKLALRRPGFVGGAFLTGYGLARSFCELFREPDAGHWLTMGPLTAGIFYSLPMIAFGIYMMRTAGPAQPGDQQCRPMRQTAATTPLLLKLRERIRRDGPLPVDDYMQACVGDPEHGYWRRRDTIGAAGDFVTAPEISQIFGELIGLWCAVTWQQLGSPTPLRLSSWGPAAAR